MTKQTSPTGLLCIFEESTKAFSSFEASFVERFPQKFPSIQNPSYSGINLYACCKIALALSQICRNSNLFYHQNAPQDHTRIHPAHKLDELAINNKKHHLQLTNDYPWSSSPSCTYSTRESRLMWGVPEVFCLPLLLLLPNTILLSSAAGLGAHNW